MFPTRASCMISSSAGASAPGILPISMVSELSLGTAAVALLEGCMGALGEPFWYEDDISYLGQECLATRGTVVCWRLNGFEADIGSGSRQLGKSCTGGTEWSREGIRTVDDRGQEALQADATE